MAALPPAATVACYAPFGTEPCATAEPPLPDALLTAGHRVLLPVLRDDLDLDWAEYRGQTTVARFGISEPVGVRLGLAAIRDVDAVIAPAVAVDRSGMRLGRGGGSYDRALARIPAGVPVIVPLYDGELLPSVPTDPHDVPVTAVVTPSDGLLTLLRSGRSRPSMT